MIHNRYIGIATMVAGMFAAVSCSEKSDYNDVPVDSSVASANQTLWQTIEQNQRLSGFKTLLQQAGFDTELQKSRAYTVWAPEDGTYNLADYQSLSKENLLKEVIKSHVAEYNHLASGSVEEQIKALNEKTFIFHGNGNYTYDGHDVVQPNVPSTNGIIHIINGMATFRPSLYEYLRVGTGIDKLRDHFLRYEITTLDEKKSVKGPVVDGMQTWMDSVMVTTNEQTNRYHGYIEREDSSYTMIVPTDKAFQSYYDKVYPTTMFVNKIVGYDYERMAGPTDTASTSLKSITIADVPYLRDSLTRREIVRHLFYSNNDEYNKWLVGTGNNTDTLRTTMRWKFSNPTDLLTTYRVGTPMAMSNGLAYIVDSLAFYPWETYNREKWVNPRSYTAKLFAGVEHSSADQIISSEVVLDSVFGKDRTFDSYRYLWVDSGGDYTKPEIMIAIPDVRATKYNFYVVYLPSAWKIFGNDPRPNWLNFQLHYCNAKGNTQTYNFSTSMAEYEKNGETGTKPKYPTKVDGTTAFINDPNKTDTLFIGSFQFPVSYDEAVTGDVFPLLHITTPIGVFNKAQKAKYSRDLRIAAIIVKPVELDEFEKNNLK